MWTRRRSTDLGAWPSPAPARQAPWPAATAVQATSGPRIDAVRASAYTIPTEAPESDGTLEWNATTLVLAEIEAGGATGIGYSYTAPVAAELIVEVLGRVIEHRDAFDTGAAWDAMLVATRNIGTKGFVATAIAAADIALWDLKARLLDVPLVRLLPSYHQTAPVYGSGGFTSYSDDELERRLAHWVGLGIPRVKMKVGRHPDRDPHRAALARRAIGGRAELFVDANGAYSPKQALALAEQFADAGVTWFEEPVSSFDLDGMRLVRESAPAGMEIAAGEYGYDAQDFRLLLDAKAVDVLQADATRCAGITGFLRAAALADAHEIDLSAHTAPALHLHPCLAVRRLRHIEYFHDHVRIERMLFDGVPEPVRGALAPDLSRPGHGLELRAADAERYRV